jgi:hypothetical protein
MRVNYRLGREHALGVGIGDYTAGTETATISRRHTLRRKAEFRRPPRGARADLVRSHRRHSQCALKIPGLELSVLDATEVPVDRSPIRLRHEGRC